MFDIFNSFSQEEFKEDKPLNNAIFANGIFQKRKAFVGTFITKQTDGDFAKFGLTKTCENSFTPCPDLPKIPVGVLIAIIDFYKEVYKKYSSEVYCAIIWDIEKKDYFVHVPTQTVSAATISYTNTPEIYNNPNYQVIMDLHSHGSMSAFFSSVDLADELESRYFAVIGELNKDTAPKMVLRAATNGVGINQEIFNVFDEHKEGLYPESNYTISLDNIDKITEQNFSYGKGSAVGNNHLYSSYLYEDDYDWPTKSNATKAKNGIGYSNGKDLRSNYAGTAPFTSMYPKLTALRYARDYMPATAQAFFGNAVDCLLDYYTDLQVSPTDIAADLEQFFHKLNKTLDTLPEEDPAFNLQQNIDDPEHDFIATSPTVA